jgi:hypothetical protein
MIIPWFSGGGQCGGKIVFFMSKKTDVLSSGEEL